MQIIIELFTGFKVKCGSGQFQCDFTRKCIPIGWMCDGDPDCGYSDKFGIDMSDEDDEKCAEGNGCPANQARCKYVSECRPIRMFCDNHNDCPDNSDEFDFCGKYLYNLVSKSKYFRN